VHVMQATTYCVQEGLAMAILDRQNERRKSGVPVALN
jgi:hypothetical protein